ncbi:MAG: aspartate aminotransferase family protein [Chloroflexi bacterium]|jgi:putrescine---pyruvate transaminase|nr:aspartate aminotransferase family protein [Chloroflexota bacterium]MBT7080796.1 aspartate aminotransferase family protein [Chloroflexota bacterium]MBT7289312.1 aspartate aminotransferase family protein [Chloroflexota bacterium]
MTNTSADQLVQWSRDHILPSGMPLGPFAKNGPPKAAITAEAHRISMTDVNGNTNIAGSSSAVNVNLGYSNPELAQAAYDQLIKMGNGGFTPGGGSSASIEYAHALAQVTPDHINRFMFVHSGSEGNDSAYKIARYYWTMQGKPNKYKIISRKMAYHGLTIGSMYATDGDAFRKNYGPELPGYVQIPAVHCYHCPFNKTYPGCNFECAESLADAIEKEDADTVAAFVAEPIYGVAGTLIPPAEYLPKIRAICDQYDVLYIDDEVMTGFGRTGKYFATEHWDVKADLLIMSKGMTGAQLPLAGVGIADNIFDGMSGKQAFVHFHSTGGHPACCAVGIKVLEIMKRDNLVHNSAVLGERLLNGINQMTDHPHIADAHGLGLFAGFEIIKDKDTATSYDPALAIPRKFTEATSKRGLGVRASVSTGRIQVAPPLVSTADDIDKIVEIMQAALADMQLD